MRGLTITLEDTVIVVKHVRMARLEPSYSATSKPADGGWHTLVWVENMPHAFSIMGDHLDALRSAIEAQP